MIPTVPLLLHDVAIGMDSIENTVHTGIPILHHSLLCHNLVMDVSSD
jgi:hypothetical protein